MNILGMSVFSCDEKEEMRIDPWTYLTKERRILFLCGTIEQGAPILVSGIPVPHMNVTTVTDFILALDALSSKPIKLIIDSYGGSVEDGLALYDIMQVVRSPIYTIGRGSCASMAAILLAAGAAGHRYAFPNCCFMLHLAKAQAQGDRHQREKMEKVFREYDKRIAEIIIRHCRKNNMTPEQVLGEWDEERELWMFAEEAVSYGLIDQVVTPEIYRQDILSYPLPE